MSFLLDTDTCSAHLKGDHGVWQKAMQYTGRLHVSAITVGELFAWALRSNAPPARRTGIENLLQDVVILPVTEQVGERFGEVRASQLDQGTPTPVVDLLIAATALVHGLTLVTHNVSDFANVPGLGIEDWITP